MQDLGKKIPTFRAKCANCGELFDHPSLSDMAYGEFVFCSENGKIYAYSSAFEPSAKLIEVLLPDNCGADLFQAALAGLSDPILGQQLTTKIHCPKCCSINLEFWHGEQSGSIWVQGTNYNQLLSLNRKDIIARVREFAKSFKA